MLCGFTPFADSADMDETFIYERILHEDMSMHIECVEGEEELDLMQQVCRLFAWLDARPSQDILMTTPFPACSQLFERDVHKRIGCSRDGMMAFKSHPFFEETDWAKIATVGFERNVVVIV